MCKIYLTKCRVITMENIKMKLARVEARLSQDALAKLIGVSRQTINMIERGEYNPSLQLCIKICKALNRTLDQLFWEVN